MFILLVCLSYEIVASEPEFDSTYSEVTVMVGEDAVLPCTVYNLGSYKVSLYFLFATDHVVFNH